MAKTPQKTEKLTENERYSERFTICLEPDLASYTKKEANKEFGSNISRFIKETIGFWKKKHTDLKDLIQILKDENRDAHNKFLEVKVKNNEKIEQCKALLDKYKGYPDEEE